MIDIEQVPPERPMPAARRYALREVLMAEVRRSRPWWRRSRQAATVGVGAIALVLVGGAATAYVAFQPATDKHSVRCYTEPRMDGDATETTLAVAEPSDPGSETSQQPGVIEDPIDACAGLWEQGLIGAGSSGADPDPAAGPSDVPKLVSCTLEDGTAAVFPGGADTCRGLDLPRTAGVAPR
jgi:hypothetical protein